MSILFETESGSHYEIRRTSGHSEIRRFNAGYRKRADAEWVRLLGHGPLIVGVPAALNMASLAAYGPDDSGLPDGDAGYMTVRVTSPVTRVWSE